MTKKLAIAKNMVSPYWHDVFERLTQKGWQITIFVSVEQEQNRLYKPADYSIYSFDVVKSKNVTVDLRALRINTNFLHLQWGLWRDLKQYKPDVILSNQLGIRTLIASIYGIVFSVPVIPWVCVSSHTERNNHFLREYFRNILLKRAPSLCTNLTDAIGYLTAKHHVPDEKIFCTPYVVDVNKYHAAVQKYQFRANKLRVGMKLCSTVFLYVGQMIPRKGLNELVASLQKMHVTYREQMSIIFVGGTLPETLCKKLTDSSVHNVNISFVQPQELPLYYAMADVFIFPSLEDEWGIVINEAAAASLPIISSIFAAATTDLVVDGFNGFRINPYNDVQLATAIERMVKLSVAERRDWGKRSFRNVKALDINYTVENMHAALQYALK